MSKLVKIGEIPDETVNADPHASSAQETALWRCKLQQRLSSLLDGRDLSELAIRRAA